MKQRINHIRIKKPLRTRLLPQRRMLNENISTLQSNFQLGAAGSFPTGHILVADFDNNSGRLADQFRASFTVPASPATLNAQSVYLYIGMQNDAALVQCILQWGNSAAGGDDNKWYLVCMQVPPAGGGVVSHVRSEEVQPGETFTATINQKTDPAGNLIWALGFSDGTTMDCAPTGDLEQYSISLETAGMTGSSDYPLSDTFDFSNIFLSGGNQEITPQWRDDSKKNFNGEKLTFSSNGGLVTIRFR